MSLPAPPRRRAAFNGAALLESARVGTEALRANPLRTLLATTGVVIGVTGVGWGA